MHDDDMIPEYFIWLGQQSWKWRKILRKIDAFNVIFEELPESEEVQALCKLAADKNTSIDILAKLALDKNEIVRYAVSKNNNTPKEILVKLAEDEKKNVRGGVASNPCASAEVLIMLSNDDIAIRLLVAKHKNTPVDLLIKWANIGYKPLKSSVDENLDIFDRLRLGEETDDTWMIRCGVAENRNAPIDILTKLADDENMLVRISVASNPNTPLDIINKLLMDKHEWVRWSAEKNLNMYHGSNVINYKHHDL